MKWRKFNSWTICKTYKLTYQAACSIKINWNKRIRIYIKIYDYICKHIYITNDLSFLPTYENKLILLCQHSGSHSVMRRQPEMMLNILRVGIYVYIRNIQYTYTHTHTHIIVTLCYVLSAVCFCKTMIDVQQKQFWCMVMCVCFTAMYRMRAVVCGNAKAHVRLYAAWINECFSTNTVQLL